MLGGNTSFYVATVTSAIKTELEGGSFMQNFSFNVSMAYSAARLSQYGVDNWWSRDDLVFFNYNDITATYGLYDLTKTANNRWSWW